MTADLRDTSQCDALIRDLRPDIILHLAWNLEKPGFLNADVNNQWLEISLHLLQIFQEFGGKRFVFAGSSSEYGYNQTLCSEGGAASPSDLYGQCKLAFTKLAASFCEVNDISFVSIRYFPVYGPGESHLLHAIPTAIHTMLQGEPFICKAPNNIWDYIYIDDVAAATIKIINSSYCGIVNVASGIPHQMREVSSVIAQELNAEHLLQLNEANSSKEVLLADTAVLDNVIGYRCKTGLSEGIRRSVQWWKTQQDSGSTGVIR